MKIIEVEGLKFNVRDAFDEETIKETEIFLDRYRAPKDARIVIDIGAHLGGTAIACASRGAKVYAFEPEGENYELLLKNVSLNKMDDKIECFKLAVGSHQKNTRLYKSKKNGGNHSIHQKVSEDFEWVNVISLEQIFRENKILHCDFLKIDCEGSEFEIITTPPKTFFDRISQISIEMHPEFGTDNVAVVKFLEKIYRSDVYKHLYYYFYKR